MIKKEGDYCSKSSKNSYRTAYILPKNKRNGEDYSIIKIMFYNKYNSSKKIISNIHSLHSKQSVFKPKFIGDNSYFPHYQKKNHRLYYR